MNHRKHKYDKCIASSEASRAASQEAFSNALGAVICLAEISGIERYVNDFVDKNKDFVWKQVICNIAAETDKRRIELISHLMPENIATDESIQKLLIQYLNWLYNLDEVKFNFYVEEYPFVLNESEKETK